MFKKFLQFISESKVDPKKKDIEQVDAKPMHTNEPETCPKCGETVNVCDCYKDDYYNAKTPQYTPRGKVFKKENKNKLK